MHTEPAAIAERGARDAHPTRPLAAVSGAVEVFAVELPRLPMVGPITTAVTTSFVLHSMHNSRMFYLTRSTTSYLPLAPPVAPPTPVCARPRGLVR